MVMGAGGKSSSSLNSLPHLAPQIYTLTAPSAMQSMTHLSRQDGPHKIRVINLATTRIHSLQQLIHLIIRHLLAEIRENYPDQPHASKSRNQEKLTIPQLRHANHARELLVKHLKAPRVFLWISRVSETAWSVQHGAKGIVVELLPEPAAQRRYLRESRVLAAGA